MLDIEFTNSAYFILCFFFFVSDKCLSNDTASAFGGKYSMLHYYVFLFFLKLIPVIL